MTDRDRLIELLEQAKEKAKGTLGSMNNGFGAWYADYILADGWIRPPCKVGDKVYRIFNGEIYEHKVSNIIYRGLQSRWQIDCIPFMAYVYDEIGKTVFLTKEEAEEKLTELKIKENYNER